jgi:predicted RNase H-like HicB family nuclease
MAGLPSVAEEVAYSNRISLVRAGDGPDAPWLAEVEDLPDCSATASTPEDAVRRAWAAAEEALGRSASGPKHSGKLLVRMPATLHDELARAAEGEGVSLNQFITGVLSSAVEWRTGGADGAAGHSDRLQHTRRLLIANFAVVLLAASVALTLLVAAWRG